MDKLIELVHQGVKEEYIEQNRILTFDEYVDLVRKDPTQQLRTSAQYVVDMMESFGRDGKRFKLFNQDFVDERFKLIGHEIVQEQIYNILHGLINEGVNNKLVLLHGPNGSAKSSIVACLMRGMEEYSHHSNGAIYRFHWIFPVDRHGKPGFGFASNEKSSSDEYQSFAKLQDSEIAARVSCDLRDHPLFLIPVPQRKSFLQEVSKNKTQVGEYLLKGDLSQKSKKIFEALLRSYKGDYKKVLRHVQVERFYISKRYREAAVTIEPQMHVDAEARQITMDKSASMLPSALHFLSLYDLSGDLVDGNRGIVEYNDILKRPIDAFKYLLTTTETGTVSVAGTVAFLDSVLIGTCNEAQLDAFKEYPDFPSFKARIELVRVPYILEVSKETEIYRTQIKRLSGDQHVAPHTIQLAAYWAVLSRLKKPNASYYPGSFAYLINSLSPIEKAHLYDGGEMPARLSSEEKKLLRAHVGDIRKEYQTVPFYEGRLGPSPREMKIILFNALERSEKGILSPLGLFTELEDFVKRTSEYEYLREDVVDGYHDFRGFIQTIRDVYLEFVDNEVRSCLGENTDIQYSVYLRKYIVNITAFLKKEKVRNPVSGTNESPDVKLMEEFEKIAEVAEDRSVFRQNLLSSLGAYALDNPNAQVDYAKVFPELLKKLKNHYADEHASILRKIYDVVTVGKVKNDKTAHEMFENMKSKFGYNDVSAQEAFVYLMQKRY